jgi:uncharacterized membrane protein
MRCRGIKKQKTMRKSTIYICLGLILTITSAVMMLFVHYLFGGFAIFGLLLMIYACYLKEKE